MSSTEPSPGLRPEVVLRLDDVSHSFSARKENFEAGEHHVLRGVSFDVYRGEVLGVVGRNGVGKTTLLRLMAGILAPRSGQIEMKFGLSCALLSLGLGFQPQLSGRDNARLAAMLQGSSVSEAEAALEEIASFSELETSFDEPVKTYSAGMRARLGFATSLFTHVDILLIDEVLAVGDAEFRRKARQAMLRKLAGDQTVVLVSHAEPQVKSLCSRAILLEEGRLVLDGTPDEVFERYGR
jgi:lipopolysaccharide transport system ATP-binding protein